MQISKENQLIVLNAFAECFGLPAADSAIDKIQAAIPDEQECDATLLYLEAHGLIVANLTKTNLGYFYNTSEMGITHKGLDYLSDDGGLTAELGKVTIRIDEETIKQIIQSRIDESDLPDEEKSMLKKSVAGLSGEAIKHLATKIVDSAFENMPNLLQIAQKFFVP